MQPICTSLFQSLTRRLALLAIACLCCATALLSAPLPAFAQAPDDEIVYVDAQGVIRVYDPQAPAERSPLAWRSPIGGYTHIALIDANRDGDMEIAGLRLTATGSVLDIYDPAIVSGAFDPDQAVDGIPWRLLYSHVLVGSPALLAAGNLDNTIAGDELLISESAGFDGSQQTLYFLRNLAQDGTVWDTVPLNIPGEAWSEVALGDMDLDGLAEIGLLEPAETKIEIWQMRAGGAISRIYRNEQESRPWQHIAMGDFRGTGRHVLAAVRDAPPPFATLVMFRHDIGSGQIEDDYTQVLSPGPNWVFFGDLNASGDDEVFLLRAVAATDTRVRLITRNRGDDTQTFLLEDRLDSDNGFRVGAAGDIDGDGKDEVVVLRNTQLRMFNSPELNASATNQAVASDARNLLVGDLDRNGFIQEVVLSADPAIVTGVARAGESGSEHTITLTNESNARAIAFAYSVAGMPSWVAVSANRAVTPATITVRYDARRLDAGSYSAELRITSSDAQVFEQPLLVRLNLNVGNGVIAHPNALAFFAPACNAETPAQTQTVRVEAPAGTTYTASLVAAQQSALGDAQPAAVTVTWPSTVPWATAISTGQAPDEVAITVDFAKAEADVAQASLIIIANMNGTTLTRTVPITLMCAPLPVYIPLLQR